MTARWPRTTFLLSIVFFLIATVTQPFAGLASTQSAWLSTAPVLEYFDNRTPTVRANYNADCLIESGLVRRAAIIPSLIPPQVSEQRVEGCAVYTPYGKFINGLLRRNNTDLYGTLSESFRPIPGSDHAIRFYGGTNQVSNAYLIPNVFNLLKPETLTDGKIRFDLKPYEPQYLRDKKGSLLDIDHNSAAYSKNGQWLIASTFQGLARINLHTQAVLLFDEPLRYHSGFSPGVQAAITPDGRYAAVASAPTNRFRIYDLQNCPITTDETLDRRACRYKELYPQLTSAAGQSIGLIEVRFLSNYKISFYRQEQSKSQQIVVSVPGGESPKFDYLALGDSYTSGEGAYHYRDGTDTTLNRCRNSWLSYPYLIKQGLSLDAAESVACAGATTWDVANNDDNYPGQVKDSVKKRDRQAGPILESFSPGYLPQKEFVSHHQPSVVTVSAGGNNIGFGDKLVRCLKPGTCFKSYEDRLEVLREIDSQLDEAVRLYEEIKRSVQPDTKIYAIGYPEIAKDGGRCGVNVRLDQQEVEFSNLIIGRLNTLIKTAAARSGVAYVDVTQAFHGHRLCEAAYSDIAINGLTAGNDKINWWFIHGPIASESYHPNALGHRLYREAILKQTSGFDLFTPMPSSVITPLTEDPSQPLLTAPKTGRKVHALKYDPYLSSPIATKNQPVTISLDIEKWALKPGTTAKISLNESTEPLVSKTVSEEGELAVSVTLPAETPVGPNNLHAYAESISGESLDIYKTVYVADSTQDLDGDGINNSADSCLVISGQTEDYDLDGIDDACDGQVSDLPGTTPPAASNLDDKLGLILASGHSVNSTRLNPLINPPLSTSFSSFATRNGGPYPDKPPESRSLPGTLGVVGSQPDTSRGSLDSATPKGPSRVDYVKIMAVVSVLAAFVLVIGWRRKKNFRACRPP